MDAMRLVNNNSELSSLALTLGSAHLPNTEWYGLRFYVRWFGCTERTLKDRVKPLVANKKLDEGESPSGEPMYRLSQMEQLIVKKE